MCVLSLTQGHDRTGPDQTMTQNGTVGHRVTTHEGSGHVITSSEVRNIPIRTITDLCVRGPTYTYLPPPPRAIPSEAGGLLM